MNNRLINAVDRRGFILVDLMFSIMIFAIVFVPVLGMMIAGTLNAAMAKKIDMATNLAQMKLEEYRDIRFGELTPVGDKTAFENYPGFSYTVNLAQDGEISKTVTVTVFFHDGGRENSITLSMERIKR